MHYLYSPRAELDLAPATRGEFFTEGPGEQQKNFLGACIVMARNQGTEAGIGVILETVQQAYQYALSLGHAVMHFKTDGWISVWPIAKPPTLHELQFLVDGYIEGVDTPKLGHPFENGPIAYANDNGLGRYPLNPTFPALTGCELFDGPAVMIVGAYIDDSGETVLV